MKGKLVILLLLVLLSSSCNTKQKSKLADTTSEKKTVMEVSQKANQGTEGIGKPEVADPKTQAKQAIDRYCNSHDTPGAVQPPEYAKYIEWHFVDNWATVARAIVDPKQDESEYVTFILYRDDKNGWKIVRWLAPNEIDGVTAANLGLTPKLCKQLGLNYYDEADGENAGLEVEQERQIAKAKKQSSQLTREETERAISDWFDLCRKGQYDEADYRLHRISRNYYGAFGIDLPKGMHDEMQKGTKWTWKFKEETEEAGSGIGHAYIFSLFENGNPTHSITTAVREDGKIKVIVIEV